MYSTRVSDAAFQDCGSWPSIGRAARAFMRVLVDVTQDGLTRDDFPAAGLLASRAS
jgi:hypothetical protein